MKIVFFSAHKFEQQYLSDANKGRYEIKLMDINLNEQTTKLANGCDVASIFVSDKADAPILELLKQEGIKSLALRSAGFNNVDLPFAKKLGMRVTRVPGYSPYAVAEHTVMLMLALNRKLIKAHNRIMDQNFSLDGLVGFDLNGKTVGIIGTGKIGTVVAKILHGFGCKIIAYDVFENKEIVEKYEAHYTELKTLCKESDIITLHIPLMNQTRHIINRESIARMKPGVLLINTSRGGLVDSHAVIDAIKNKQIGYFGMDVYEEEEGLFFEDHSEDVLLDDVLARLMTMSNVLITGHQAFLTDTALINIAASTFYNLDCFEKGIKSDYEL